MKILFSCSHGTGSSPYWNLVSQNKVFKTPFTNEIFYSLAKTQSTNNAHQLTTKLVSVISLWLTSQVKTTTLLCIVGDETASAIKIMKSTTLAIGNAWKVGKSRSSPSSRKRQVFQRAFQTKIESRFYAIHYKKMINLLLKIFLF